MIKAFKQTSSSDANLVALNVAIKDFVTPLVQNPMLDGRLLRNIALSTTSTAIPHQLGRRWVGYIITKADVGTTYSYDGTANAETYLTLVSGAPVTVDIWVF